MNKYYILFAEGLTIDNRVFYQLSKCIFPTRESAQNQMLSFMERCYDGVKYPDCFAKENTLQVEIVELDLISA